MRHKATVPLPALCSHTSAVAAWRCQDKAATRRVLAAAGLSLPPGRLATFDDDDVPNLSDITNSARARPR